jgi:hypothetical protein
MSGVSAATPAATAAAAVAVDADDTTGDPAGHSAVVATVVLEGRRVAAELSAAVALAAVEDVVRSSCCAVACG